MTKEMHLASEADRPRLGFARVVQQRRPTHGGTRRRLTHHPHRVIPEVFFAPESVTQIEIGLGQERFQLWQSDTQQPGSPQDVEAMIDIGTGQEAGHLHEHPLLADPRQAVGTTPHCLLGLRIEAEPEWETKRAAQEARNPPANRSSASPTARTSARAISASPPHGSTTSPLLASIAMALIVKSRRARSSSSVASNATAGNRVSSWIVLATVGGHFDRDPVLAKSEDSADRAQPLTHEIDRRGSSRFQQLPCSSRRRRRWRNRDRRAKPRRGARPRTMPPTRNSSSAAGTNTAARASTVSRCSGGSFPVLLRSPRHPAKAHHLLQPSPQAESTRSDLVGDRQRQTRRRNDCRSSSTPYASSPAPPGSVPASGRPFVVRVAPAGNTAPVRRVGSSIRRPCGGVLASTRSSLVGHAPPRLGRRRSHRENHSIPSGAAPRSRPFPRSRRPQPVPAAVAGIYRPDCGISCSSSCLPFLPRRGRDQTGWRPVPRRPMSTASHGERRQPLHGASWRRMPGHPEGSFLPTWGRRRKLTASVMLLHFHCSEYG